MPWLIYSFTAWPLFFIDRENFVLVVNIENLGGGGDFGYVFYFEWKAKCFLINILSKLNFLSAK